MTGSCRASSFLESSTLQQPPGGSRLRIIGCEVFFEMQQQSPRLPQSLQGSGITWVYHEHPFLVLDAVSAT